MRFYEKALIFGIRNTINAYAKQKNISTNNLKILDFGCGTGFRTNNIAKLSKSSIIGIDIDSVSIEYANKARTESNVNFKNCSLDDIKGKFDIILAIDVLEHVKNPSEIVESMTKLLKKGGIMVLHIPNGFGLMEWQYWVYKILYYTKLHTVAIKMYNFILGKKKVQHSLNQDVHVQNFTSRRVRKMLKKNKLKEVYFKGTAVVTDTLFLGIPLKFSKALQKIDVKTSKSLPLWLSSMWLIVAEA